MKKNPELLKAEQDWLRIKALMDDDKLKYILPEFMLALPNERLTARKERQSSFVSGFVNLTMMLVNAKGNSIYQKEINRQKLTLSQEEFVKRCDRSNQAFADVMQNEVATTLSAYGSVFAVLDKPKTSAVDKATELKTGNPYITILDPSQLVDFEWSEEGELLWVAYTVDSPVDRTDPLKPKRKWTADKGLAIWTKETYSVKSLDGKKDLETEITNPYGIVPFIIQSQFVPPNKTIGKSSFFASSQYLVMANNLNAASNQEVFKNASSTLLMNIQDFGDDTGEAKIEHEKNPDSNLQRIKKQTDDVPNVLLYQNPSDKPSYLTRDLQLIELAEKRSEKYFELIFENEKSGLSVESLKSPKSGVAKGYDFKDVNKTLCSFANALNHFENQVLAMVARISGEAFDKFSVAYPTDYDERGFIERIDMIKGLAEALYPSKTGIDLAYKSFTKELTKSEELRNIIDAEIDKAPKPTQPIVNTPFMTKAYTQGDN